MRGSLAGMVSLSVGSAPSGGWSRSASVPSIGVRGAPRQNQARLFVPDRRPSTVAPQRRVRETARRRSFRRTDPKGWMIMNEKTVLITGCSSGFGRLAARTFHQNRWNVIATMRTPENETELTELDGVLVTRMDVTEPESVRQAVSGDQ